MISGCILFILINYLNWTVNYVSTHIKTTTHQPKSHNRNVKNHTMTNNYIKPYTTMTYMQFRGKLLTWLSCDMLYESMVMCYFYLVIFIKYLFLILKWIKFFFKFESSDYQHQLLYYSNYCNFCYITFL